MRGALWCAAAVIVGMLGGCGEGGVTESNPQLGPRQLIITLGDLPRGFNLLPGESIPTPTSWVLADPWSTGHRALIRRERVAGYQSSFWTSERRRLQCEVAVYRSARSARRVYALRTRRFAATMRRVARPVPVSRIGEAAHAFRLEGGWSSFTVSWRYRTVLSVCAEDGLDARSFQQVRAAALVQQRRLAGALGPRERP